ncbi:hypothetical protein C4544_02505 [candidate division WS5 bacterium]|uniref:PilN domain-containing protein n=1 Tax=candidate division WS5 bacterium TaxID=2093353 RepID=A0A419DEL5_9BACT|nr:MAG: hypothetical protein C4544_02505 [candidate division WS5 bacterium]
MTKINLAPEVRQEKIKTKKRNFFVTMTAVLVIAAVLIFILILQGYRWSRVYSLDRTKEKIASTQDELKGYKDIEEMVINIEKGLKAVEEIESNQPKWSKFVPVLEQVTPNDIKFVELSMDGNKFTAKAEGKQVQSIARAIKSLEDYKYQEKKEGVSESSAKEGRLLFTNVNVDGYKAGGSGVEFEMTFEVEQGVLW